MNFARIPAACRLASLLLLAGALASSPSLAQNVAAGQSKFNNFCVPCHGFPPVGGPDRAGNNPTLIMNAINGKVPAMGFLRSAVSNADIADIAAFLGTLSIPGTPPPPPPPPPDPNQVVPAFNYTDLWWAGESESGWGVNITQHASNKLFVVMYTYDLDRRSMWLVLPDGTWSSPQTYSGPFYRVTGPPQTAPTFNSALVNVAPVGNASLAFTDSDHATFTFSVNGVQVTKLISRTPF